ncbi:PREDICTED: uncharacterized protein LOC107356471 [Acropora digitifera]|uniref:uncharacterized protein LOC107356471 n=1 Tax=Acropora digitifera TaxID=70779 RepID=UPI00077A2AB4|nr:PREDICTED: uncharacterized protein LOC107356471 [Acropora digitifera]
MKRTTNCGLPSQSVSNKKTRKSNNQYFNLQIQTSNEVYRTACFLPDKHPLLKGKLESSSSIKIHRYQLKKNERSEENDLILNKRTKIEDPDDCETDFDSVSEKTETTQAIEATTEEIHNGDAHTVNVHVLSCTFLHKIEAKNQGCSLSMDTSVFGVLKT